LLVRSPTSWTGAGLCSSPGIVAHVIGPGIGGLVGAGATFLLNAVSFLGVMLVLYRWERPLRQNFAPLRASWGRCVRGFDIFGTLSIFKLCLWAPPEKTAEK
jgi:hypothetical protein